MRVRFILLRFLIILLVSVLFSVNNCFVCYFRLLKLIHMLNSVYVSDNIQHEKLPISLEVGRIYF